MAVDYLSALNVGSGLNTTEIIDALVEAERAPKASEINSAKEKRTVEISSLGQIKQGFETFDTALAPVEKITGLSVASSGSGVEVKISDAKLATNFSHSMEVSIWRATPRATVPPPLRGRAPGSWRGPAC